MSPLSLFVAALVGLLLFFRVFYKPRRLIVYEFQRGLLFRKGRFQRLLEPGQYWVLEPTRTITVIDIRPTFLSLVGQEVLTADGVPLKVSIAASYEVADPVVAYIRNSEVASSVYLMVQLAVRQVISATNVDDLMSNRAEFGAKVLAAAGPAVQTRGIHLIQADLKDIMISGDLKKSFAQVVKARKEGQAALERARGETAALRNLANAARMVQDNPQLMQLRMLQVMGDNTGNTLVVGMPAGSTPLPIRNGGAPPPIDKASEDPDQSA